jgi:hypothetical protein
MGGTGKHHLKSNLSGAESQKPHIFSYVVCRPNTNAAILLKIGHTKGR